MTLTTDHLDTPTAPTPEAMANLARRLEEAEARVRDLGDGLRNRITWHEADIAHIGQCLLEQADNRSWCGEFDEYLEECNRRLHVKLETRAREYYVTVPVTVFVTLPVTARDDDDAAEEASQCYDSGSIDSMAEDALRSGGGTVDWSAADVELADG